MIEIILSQTPNQSFSIELEGHQYDFIFMSINTNNLPGVGIMAVDIVRDNILLVSGNRLPPLFPLIPYRYLENGEGNFIFTTLNDDYPDYNQFGITQSLLYLTASEVEVIRAGT